MLFSPGNFAGRRTLNRTHCLLTHNDERHAADSRGSIKAQTAPRRKVVLTLGANI